jgi:basic membrane lipoprotein Med (substrate-binding protein (PBP1-ABC) superfamily)
VLGSALVRQDQAAYEKTSLAIEGKLEYGSAIILDARAGFVGFDDTDPLYRKYVPEKIRNEESHMIERMKSGSFRLLMPTNLNPPKEATN